MNENCNHSCSSCTEDCAEREENQRDFSESLYEMSSIKKVIGFGDSHIDEIADKHNLKVLAKLPIDPKISAACDKGTIEFIDENWLESVAKILAENKGL